MKPFIISLVLVIQFFAWNITPAFAVTAYPHPVEYLLPDGNKITIQLKGDEKIRWAETLDGYSILMNAEGFYEYALLDSNGDMQRSGIRVSPAENRSQAERDLLSKTNKGLGYSQGQIDLMKQIWNIKRDEAQKNFPTNGNRKLICVLIGFTDLAFSKTQSEFTDLFNQVGYTNGGATGSVKDYYIENSYNQLNLTVDVAGPYIAGNNMAYYGANDTYNNDVRPRELAAEAIHIADAAVDYANYDNDGDGWVDGVYIIYAGYGEEAGASPNAIWAHAWSLATPLLKDGVSINRYSCSPELRSNGGTTITAIGVICHEFGHVLGAPDYYDTDYSTGGQYQGTGYWDMMASGSWNNDGVTPAHHNGYTKVYYYHWADAITLSTDQNITLYNASQNANSFYRYNTATTDEFFLLENREMHLFDSYIPGSGMLIYHVHSGINAVGNAINATHPQRMYPVSQNATSDPSSTSSSYGAINSASCAWTGTEKTTFTDATLPSSKSWASTNTSKSITNISRNATEKTVSFDFTDGGQSNETFPLSENFEGEAFPPLGWSVYDVDASATVRTWVISTAQNHTSGGTKSSSHNYGPATQTEDGWLVTPKIPLPAGIEIELAFWSFNAFPTYYGKNSVLISTTGNIGGSADFVEIWTTVSVADLWTETILDLTAFAGQDVYIAFRYQGRDAHRWHMDDVSLEALPDCPAPYDLTTTNITLNSVELGWSDFGDPVRWDVLYGKRGFDPVSEGTLVEQVQANALTLENLNHSTYYEFYVRGYCDNAAGDWSMPGLFRTECGENSLTFITPSAQDVFNIVQNNIIHVEVDFEGCNANYVNLKLQDINGNNTKFYYYGLQFDGSDTYSIAVEIPQSICSGSYRFVVFYYDNQTNSQMEYYSDYFTIENNSDNLSITDPILNQYLLTGKSYPLRWNSSTDQEVNLYYSLDGGASWVTIVQDFSNQCGFYHWGYNDYTWIVPTSITGTYNNALFKVELASDPTVFAISDNFTITSVVPIVITSPQQGDIFLQGEDIQLNFDVTVASWVQIILLYPDGNSQELYQYNASEGPNNYSINNNNLPTGYGYRFLVFHSNFGQSFIGDHFAVADQYPDCVEPMHIEANNISSSGADISWTSYSEATSWSLEWNVNYFEPGNGNLIEGIAQNSYTMQGLPQGQYIYLYVTAKCANGLVSIPSQFLSFTTSCSQWGIPYAEDFESYQVNRYPNCWYSYNQNLSIDPDIYNSAVQSARIQVYQNTSNLLVTPAIAANLQELSLKFKALSYYEPIEKSIIVGTVGNPNDESSFEPLEEFHLLCINGQPWQEFNLSLHAAPASHKYIAFRVVGNQDNWNTVYLDDISLEFLPECPVPYNLTIENLSQSSADIGWDYFGTTPYYDVLYGKKGFDPLTEGTLIEQVLLNELTLGNLNHSTYYEFYARGYCDGTAGGWSSPGLFRTDCGENNFTIITPTAQDVFDIVQNNIIHIEVDFEGCIAYNVNVVLQEINGNNIKFYNYGLQFNGSDTYSIAVEIPQGICSGSYRFVVLYYDNQTNSQLEYTSDYFTIENTTPYLEINRPALNQNLVTALNYQIRWNSSLDQLVNLYYSLDDGSVWVTIAQDLISSCGFNQAGLNEYSWNVPTTITGTYNNARIKVELASDPAVFAVSDNFTITSVVPIVITSPQQGDIFLQGEDIQLSFDVTGESWVQISLIYPEGNSQELYQYFASEGPNTYSIVNNNLPTGYGYRFEVYHSNFGNGFFSDYFAVADQYPDCVEPMHIEVNNISSSGADISWTSYGEATSWSIEWNFNYFEPGTGNLIDGIAQNSYTMQGLPHGRNIYFYVTAHCSNGFISNPSQIFNYSTTCSQWAIPFVEDFESYQVNIFPNCWYTYNQNLSIVPDTYNSAVQCARIEAYQNTSNLLVTPAISGNLQELSLKFMALSYNEPIEKSIIVGTVGNPNDDSSFEPLEEFHLLSINGQPWQEFSLSLHAAPASHKYIAFRVVGNQDNWNTLYLDDISLEFLPECPVPYNLTIENLSQSSADIGWDYFGTPPYYDVLYGKKGFDPLTEGTLIEQVLLNELTLGNLNHSTYYEFYARGYCDGAAGDWSSPGLFRTDCGEKSLTFITPTAQDVFDIVQSNIIDVEVDFKGCMVNNVNMKLQDINGNNTSYNYYGLQFNGSNTYTFAIEIPQSICSGSYRLVVFYYDDQTNSQMEYYSDYFTIENSSDNLSISNPILNQNLLTGKLYPLRWNSSTDQYVNLYYSIDDGTTWITIVQDLNSQCGFYMWGYNNYGWNVPTTITGTYNNARIKVELASDPSVYDVSDNFTITSVYPIVITSPQQGDVFLQGEDIQLNFDVTGESGVQIWLLQPNGGSQNLHHQFASEGPNTYSIVNNNLSTGYGYRFMIIHNNFGDSFIGDYFAVVDQYPDCVEPMHIEVNNISNSGADISWTSYSEATSWNLEWGLQFFEPGNGNLIEGITQNSYSMQGLPQGRSIYFYVTAYCSNGFVSNPSQIFNYSTTCNQWEIPYLDDFESYTLNSVLNCWSSTGASKQIVNDQFLSPDQSVRIQAQPNGTSMLITPLIDANLQSLYLKFHLLPDNQPGEKSIQIGSVKTDGDPDSFHLLAQFELLNIQGQPWQEFNLPLSDAIPTHKRIAFKVINNHDNWTWVYLDDISLEFLPECPVPYNLTIENLGQSSADISWDYLGTTPYYDVLYGKKGFDALSEGTLIQQVQLNELTLENLNHSSYYQFYVRGYCDGAAGDWSSPGLFRTDCGEKSLTFINPTAQDVFDIVQSNIIDVEVDFKGCMANYVNMKLQDINGNTLENYTIGLNFFGSDIYTIAVEIPQSICYGSYRFVVFYYDNESNSQMEYASDYFTIENSSANLDIVSPSLNQNFLTGRLYAFSWNSSTDQQVNLYYSIDDGANWVDIAQNLDSQCGFYHWGYNSFGWNVPTTIIGTYNNARIKIELASDPSVFDISDNFTITSVEPVVITNPQQGDVFLQGEDIQLNFDVTSASWIEIMLLYPGGGILDLYQYNASEGPNTYALITDDLPIGYGYQFMIFHGVFGEYFTSPFFAILNEIPSCVKPVNLAADRIGYIDTDVSWQSGNNETSWIISYGYQGFIPGTENQTEILTTNNAHIALGQHNASYDIYVRANCDEVNQSAWEGPLRIQTKTLPEGWEPSLNLPFEMELIAKIKINNAISLNPDDILGAFIGNQCVGIGTPNPDQDGLITMSLFSYNSAYDPVHFKLFDSQMQEICDAGPGFIFEHGTTIGSEANPWIVRCMEQLTQNLSFGQGYTWFSLNVNPGSMSPGSLFSGLSPCYDDRVIGQTSFALYTGSNWIGSLNSLSMDKMYRMKLCSAQNLSLTGEVASLNPINLAAGYTWLGYQPQECQTVSAAMAGLSPGPSYNDRVIGQNSFALYTGTAWIGSLTQLCPGKGYIVKLANAQSLTYPAGTSKGSPVAEAETTSPTGVYPVENMQHTMMVMAQLRLTDGSISLNEKDVVYAMIDGEVRAIGHPMVGADGIIFLSIAENTEHLKPITFTVWLDDQQALLPLNETLSFEPLAAIGEPNNPFILTLGEMVGVDELTDGIWIGEPYPNPFSAQTTVPYFLNEAAELSYSIFNSRGVQVRPAQSIATDKGHHQLSIKSFGLASGVYVLEVSLENIYGLGNKRIKLIVQ